MWMEHPIICSWAPLLAHLTVRDVKRLDCVNSHSFRFNKLQRLTVASCSVSERYLVGFISLFSSSIRELNLDNLAIDTDDLRWDPNLLVHFPRLANLSVDSCVISVGRYYGTVLESAMPTRSPLIHIRTPQLASLDLTRPAQFDIVALRKTLSIPDANARHSNSDPSFVAPLKEVTIDLGLKLGSQPPDVPGLISLLSGLPFIETLSLSNTPPGQVNRVLEQLHWGRRGDSANAVVPTPPQPKRSLLGFLRRTDIRDPKYHVCPNLHRLELYGAMNVPSDISLPMLRAFIRSRAAGTWNAGMGGGRHGPSAFLRDVLLDVRYSGGQDGEGGKARWEEERIGVDVIDLSS